MNASSPIPAARGRWASPGASTLVAAVILCTVLAAYSNSFSAPFVFDDLPAIRDNVTIREWRDFGRVLSPPARTTVTGRPVVNASFALSHALSGAEPWGYHVVNILIHATASLLLFGLVRRTLLRPRFRGQFDAGAGPLALAAALLWALQPVQTESITYAVQRAESLMGLFYLLALYGFVRGADAPRPASWHVIVVVACALGMATKEVMVSAPLIILLYDRTFVAASWGAAWRARRGLYFGLAATWALLGFLVAHAGGNRDGSIGFGIGIGWWEHAMTQFGAVTHYLRLVFWPHPLVFEYEPEWVSAFPELAVSAALVIVLCALTVAGLWRSRPGGFVGAWCFAVLAPTSLLPAPTQLIVEHRMYLPLAAVIGGLVPAVFLFMGRRSWVAFGAIAASFLFLTHRRNDDYRSDLSLWADTVAKRPRNALARGNLGNAFSRAGRMDEALVQYREAVRLAPRNAMLHFDLGVELAKLGRNAEALAAYADAVRLQPDYTDARNNYAVALAQAGRPAEAQREFEATLRLRPDDADAHANFGTLLSDQGRAAEALEHFATALRLRPNYPAAEIEWGTALVKLGRLDEALRHYTEAARLEPRNVTARNKVGLVLLATRRVPEAIACFEAALRLAPDDPGTRANLAMARSRLGKPAPR